MLMEFALRGVGSVILPRSAVIRHIEEKSLIGSTIRGLSVKWALEISNDRKESPAVRALAEEIKALFHTQIASGRWTARERRD
jgi:DNA-binding transcriptional LysR family regulator